MYTRLYLFLFSATYFLHVMWPSPTDGVPAGLAVVGTLIHLFIGGKD